MQVGKSYEVLFHCPNTAAEQSVAEAQHSTAQQTRAQHIKICQALTFLFLLFLLVAAGRRPFLASFLLAVKASSLPGSDSNGNLKRQSSYVAPSGEKAKSCSAHQLPREVTSLLPVMLQVTMQISHPLTKV